jgi:hypothetical protein
MEPFEDDVSKPDVGHDPDPLDPTKPPVDLPPPPPPEKDDPKVGDDAKDPTKSDDVTPAPGDAPKPLPPAEEPKPTEPQTGPVTPGDKAIEGLSDTFVKMVQVLRSLADTLAGFENKQTVPARNMATFLANFEGVAVGAHDGADLPGADSPANSGPV